MQRTNRFARSKRAQYDPPTPSKNNGRRTIVKITLAMSAATLVVASLITTNASAAEPGECPECDMLPTPARVAACVCPQTVKPQKKKCPGNVWVDQGVRCPTKVCPDGKTVINVTKGEKCPGDTPPPTKCDGKNEQKAKDGSCECKDGYDYFTDAKTEKRTCKKECEDGERWDDNGVCKPVDDCGPCAAAEAKHRNEIEKRAIERDNGLMAAIKGIADSLWLLWVILLVGLANLGMNIWNRVRPPKGPGDKPKCSKCGKELDLEKDKFCPDCGTPVTSDEPDEDDEDSDEPDEDKKSSAKSSSGKSKKGSAKKGPPRLPKEKGEKDKKLTCSKCDKELPPDTKFCDKCGTPVSDGEDSDDELED